MQQIDSILTVADRYDAIVFDQWGVLHNGSAPYPTAVETIDRLKAAGHTMAVLSNSGKSGSVNRDRITGMGFASDAFISVMTSGEALLNDLRTGRPDGITSFFAITAKPGDAVTWAGDVPLRFVDDIADAGAILLMGLPDSTGHAQQRSLLQRALGRDIPLICSNPDRASPRADGVLVESPGALAHEYADAGGRVSFYGKPHRPIFDALSAQLGSTGLLMVGDSPEHDIAGAKAAGWDSLFIAGGLHADHYDTAALFADIGPPNYILPTLR